MSLEPMGCACATRQTHPWVYAFAEITLCETSGGEGSVSIFNSPGSYQAPRYHMRTMLRARNLLSASDCTLSMIVCAGALRLSLTLVKSLSKAAGCFTLSSVK